MDNYKIKNDLKKIERFKEVNESINLIIKKMKYCLFSFIFSCNFKYKKTNIVIIKIIKPPNR